MSDAELALRCAARRSALQDLAEHDLGAFIELGSPLYDRPSHLEPLLEALDRSMREPVYALVEAAPRQGKTETLLADLVRHLKYRPLDNVAYCSYAAPIALRKSRRARDMATRSGLWLQDEIVSRRKRKNRWDNSTALSFWQTIAGGSFTAGGRNSAFTGDGYQKIVYDDPFKNRAEAESAVFQDKAMEAWRGLATRFEPGCSAFVSLQPWNQFDPIAVLGAEKAGPDGQAWERISLPIVIDAEYDEAGNLIGGIPLWPARWSLPEIAKVKHRVGAYNWHSQYTLERKPRGDRPFKDPARYARPQVDGAVIIISCDPGLEDDEMKDSSGIVVAAAYRRPTRFHRPGAPDFEVCLDILLAVDEWRQTPDLLDFLEKLQRKEYRGAPVLLEEVSAFKILSQVARRLNRTLRLYPVTPKGNKLLRSTPTSEAWNEGRVRVPVDATWVDGFIRECQLFTGKAGGTDNRVDALTQLYDYAEPALAMYAAFDTGGDESAFGADRPSMAGSPY